MTTETHDFSYLECKNGERHKMDNIGDANGITSCYKCGWRAKPAWIVHQMVYMSGGVVLSVDETIRRIKILTDETIKHNIRPLTIEELRNK
jgi:hypothetical protein